MKLKQKIYNLLRWSQKYTQTDMVYLATGGFWLTLGQIISSASALLLAIAFANLLPKETYGTYRYVLSLVTILTIPTLSGINDALVRAVARGYEGSFIPALKTRLRWGILGGIASLGVAGYYFLNGNNTLTICFLIAAIFIPPMESFTIYKAVLGGKKLFKTLTIYGTFIRLISTATLVAALFLTHNIFLILLTYFVSFTFLRLIFIQITLKKSPLNKEQDPKTISYGKNLSLMSFLGIVSNQLDEIIIWFFLGAAPVAIYHFAMIIPEQITSFSGVIPSLALPKFSSHIPSSELKKSIFKKTIKLFLVVTLVAIVYILLAPVIYRLIFPQYLESIFYSQILAIAVIFLSSQLLIRAFLTSQMRTKELYIFTSISYIMKIALLLLLLPFFGIWGAITTVIITNITTLILLVILLKRI